MSDSSGVNEDNVPPQAAWYIDFSVDGAPERTRAEIERDKARAGCMRLAAKLAADRDKLKAERDKLRPDFASFAFYKHDACSQKML